jgi:large subunit ribosomal protein L4
MISVSIQDKSGQDVGTYEFDPNELAPGVNRQLLHDVAVMYASNRRVGTVRTKSRGQVVGSTRKIFRQKGTGRARMGAIRNPVRRGGGHTFAKVPRDWSYRLPKKAVRLATRMALLSKFLDREVTLLDDFVIGEPKTRVVAGILNTLGLSNTSCLLTVETHDQNLWRSSRNIPNLLISPASGLNAYDLLCQKQLVVTKAALDRLRGQSVSG